MDGKLINTNTPGRTTSRQHRMSFYLTVLDAVLEKKAKGVAGAESATSTALLSPWSEPAWVHGIPSPYYKQSHEKLRTALREYINDNIITHQLDWEREGGAPRDQALKWVKSGFSFSEVPAKYRPKDIPNPAGVPMDSFDAFHLLVGTDETSRVEGGVMTSLSGASIIGLPPIVYWGSEEQKSRWLPGVFDWSTSFSLGITEPNVGSDVANLQTTAVKTADGKHFVVNGYKKWITGVGAVHAVDE